MEFIPLICKIDWVLNLFALIALIGLTSWNIIYVAKRVGRKIGISYKLINIIGTIIIALILILNLVGTC